MSGPLALRRLDCMNKKKIKKYETRPRIACRGNGLKDHKNDPTSMKKPVPKNLRQFVKIKNCELKRLVLDMKMKTK